MFCPRCGNQIDNDAKFCRYCGTPVQAKRSSGEKLLITVISLALVAVCALIVLLLVPLRLPSPSGQPDAPEPAEEAQAGNETASGEGNADTGTAGTGDLSDSQPGTAVGSADTEIIQVNYIPRPSFGKTAVGMNTGEATISFSASVPAYTIDDGLGNVINLSEYYFSDEERALLSGNGFFVREGGAGLEFFEHYENNRYYKTPNFITVDSMMHTYHLFFSHLLKQTERNHIVSDLTSLSDAMFSKSCIIYESLKGTEWENAAGRNVAFFAVGSSLLGGSPAIPAELTDMVSSELSLINAAGGIAISPITGMNDDYTQYIPRGYYEGDTTLEAYFRAMMWYGRANFAASDEELSRSAVLMTLSFDEETMPVWESIYTVTSFFAGASDDCTYYEYKPAIEMAYGENATIEDLPGKEDAFGELMRILSNMPAPKINAVPTPDEGNEDADKTELNKGFRFMGQRFSVDGAIFQNLVYNQVVPGESEQKRMMPDALDIPAAFGSDTALQILEQEGLTAYPNYQEQMQLMRDYVESAGEDVWTASLYSRWLSTLRPLLETKGEGYPVFMQNADWTKKNLQSFLGSYTELKHDTVLYSKQVMVEMGGDLIEDKDDRGYVEPEPEIFRRLGLLTRATKEGLEGYGLLEGEDAENLDLLATLTEYLETIARKELQNEVPTEEEFEIIRSFGGQIEHFWETVHREDADNDYFSSREFPAAVVTDIASNSNGETLEVGTGKVGAIYCVVPVDGTLRIASGTVFSFYEFVHPSSDRLTDTKWKRMMGIELDEDGTYRTPEKETPEWTRSFQIPLPY